MSTPIGPSAARSGDDAADVTAPRCTGYIFPTSAMRPWADEDGDEEVEEESNGVQESDGDASQDDDETNCDDGASPMLRDHGDDEAANERQRIWLFATLRTNIATVLAATEGLDIDEQHPSRMACEQLEAHLAARESELMLRRNTGDLS